MKMNILKKTVAACSVAAFMAVGCVSVAQAHPSRLSDKYGEHSPQLTEGQQTNSEWYSVNSAVVPTGTYDLSACAFNAYTDTKDKKGIDIAATPIVSTSSSLYVFPLNGSKGEAVNLFDGTTPKAFTPQVGEPGLACIALGTRPNGLSMTLLDKGVMVPSEGQIPGIIICKGAWTGVDVKGIATCA